MLLTNPRMTQSKAMNSCVLSYFHIRAYYRTILFYAIWYLLVGETLYLQLRCLLIISLLPCPCGCCPPAHGAFTAPPPHTQPSHIRFRNRQVVHFHRRLTAALASGRLKLPNVFFIYNTDDNAPRFNAPGRMLPVPLLSLIKSRGLEDGDDLDVLVPQVSCGTDCDFVRWMERGGLHPPGE
ncbi:hypothetical protein Vretifemale_17159 [Volvox reticuliferus]|uniref:Uncharacterized protein n=1 Tax=Volvox reticuliferus TaxID=1737510 RepID=A0A8J4CV95_9CHLO|nr:hypothetical protein Vretifemale_17159 [Volvox reticuliferus]